MPRLFRVKRFSLETTKKHPDKVFVFGDNLQGWGKKGQAIIRDEPNAIGIPTKKKPSMEPSAFFTDKEFDFIRPRKDAAFAKIPKGSTVYIPEAGLGTGLAKLPEKAPRIHFYIRELIKGLEKK